MGSRSDEEVLNRLRSLLILKVATAKATGSELPFIGTDGVKRSLDLSARFKSLFLQYNRDGGGLLSYEDFSLLVRKSLRLSEQGCPDKQLRLLFDKVDTNGNGKLELSEFLNFLQQKEDRGTQTAEVINAVLRSLRLALRRLGMRCDADIRILFNSLELAEDNKVFPQELHRFCRENLRLTRHEVSDKQLRVLFQSLDFNGSNSLEAEELFDFMRAAAVARLEDVAPDIELAAKRSMERSLESPSTSSSPTLPSIRIKCHSAPSLSTPVIRPTNVQRTHLPALDRAKDLGLVGGYTRIRGANRLNGIEDRICNSGVNVRGKFFQGISDKAKFSDGLLPRSPSNKRSKGDVALQAYLVEQCV